MTHADALKTTVTAMQTALARILPTADPEARQDAAEALVTRIVTTYINAMNAEKVEEAS